MMGGGLFEEADLFIRAFLLGAVYAAIGDLFELLRKLRKHRWFSLAFEDLLFWISFGAVLFIMLYQQNDGKLRGFVLIGLAFGAYIKKQLKKAFKTVTMKVKKHREKENH